GVLAELAGGIWHGLNRARARLAACVLWIIVTIRLTWAQFDRARRLQVAHHLGSVIDVCPYPRIIAPRACHFAQILEAFQGAVADASGGHVLVVRYPECAAAHSGG